MYHKDQKYNLLLSKFLFLDVVVGGTLLLSIYIFLSNTVIKKTFHSTITVTTTTTTHKYISWNPKNSI